MEEIWKPMPIEGYGLAYEISNLGRARSIQREYYVVNEEGKHIKTAKNKGKILKNRLIRSRYSRVSLCLKDIGVKDVYIHRMVAIAFLGYPIKPEYQVNHKDGNVENNNLNNLEWVTPSENIRHAINTGLIKYRSGVENKLSKKINQYDMQDNLVRKFDCINDVKVLCNMCPSLVIDVLKGRRKSAYKSKWQYA